MITVRISTGSGGDWITISIRKEELNQLDDAIALKQLVKFRNPSGNGMKAINGAQVNWYEVI